MRCLYVLLLAVGVLFGAGCTQEQGDPTAAYEHVYTVRGRVVQLPDGSRGSGFYAQHEAIPDYVSASGSIGMVSMTMSFTIVDDAVLEGIAVGDIVEIVYGESSTPVKQGVISIEKLPSDTVLDFGEDAS